MKDVLQPQIPKEKMMVRFHDSMADLVVREELTFSTPHRFSFGNGMYIMLHRDA
jgi:hypothetical protein